VIKGKKTLLRPLDIADVTDICQDEYLSQVNARTTRMFAIEADDNVLIGDIGLVEINWRRKEAELVVRIGHPEYIGKGYGYDAISSLLDYVFSTTSARISPGALIASSTTHAS
jgi:RimJ/RimL family protein N-acetyltransferase